MDTEEIPFPACCSDGALSPYHAGYEIHALYGDRAPSLQQDCLAAGHFIARLQLHFCHDQSDSRPSARPFRLLAEFRRSFEERRPRGEAAPDRFAGMRARRVERRAVHHRPERRRGLLGRKWRDCFRHVAQSAAGLGRLRERLLHSLLRLQRYLSLEGTGAPERQLLGGARRRRKRGRDRQRNDPGNGDRLRSAMPALRCRQHSRPRLGSSDLWRFFDSLGRREIDEARSGTDPPRHQYRWCALRGLPPGAGGGTFALERRGFRERGPARRLRGIPGTGRHDRAGADLRRRDGVRKRTGSLVRQRARSIRQDEGSDAGRRVGVDDFEDEHQILAGGVSQPERD